VARLHECASSKSVLKEFGGDIIFLMRNVVHTVGLFFESASANDGIANDGIQDHRDFHVVLLHQAVQMLSDLMHRWIQNVSLCELEMHDILNIVEAMQVLNQLDITNEGLPSVESTIACLTKMVPGISTPKVLHSDSTPTFVCQERPVLSFRGSAECENCFTDKEKVCVRRHTSSPNSGSILNFEAVKCQLTKELLHFDVTDMVGWNPMQKQVPMTDPSHCGNCGTRHASVAASNVRLRTEAVSGSTISKSCIENNGQCIKCRAKLCSHVDFGGLTDALVWSYLFECVDVPLVFNNAHFSFTDIVRLLPQVRKYYGLDELGHDFFQLQCYYLTHFIYVVSDWGRHSLRRALFQEEFIFLVNYLPTLVSQDDPELVGEFIHCLHILEVSKGTDPTLWDLIEYAMCYLLEVERKCGNKGAWKKNSSSVYDRYHSSFCGAVGLLVFDFHGNALGGNMSETPIPRAFRYTAPHTRP